VCKCSQHDAAALGNCRDLIATARCARELYRLHTGGKILALRLQYLKPILLELGASPLIVLDDADLNAAWMPLPSVHS